MRQVSKHHSYEELRGVVVDILLRKESIRYGARDFSSLVNGVAEVLVRRGSPATDQQYVGSPDEIRLDPDNLELVRDVFWDLFRQGVITLGSDDNHEAWPWFRLSHYGARTLLNQSPFRFHDAASYLGLVKTEVPDISSEALTYLDEAVATFYSDCLLASCVMLGVAAETEFLSLVRVGRANRSHAPLFEKADKERTIRQKILKFQNGLKSLPTELLEQAGEDIETHLNAIQSVLRVARNEAGHVTTAKPPSREQVYVFLQLFIPFAKQLAQLRVALG